jgi:hypothetical protein
MVVLLKSDTFAVLHPGLKLEYFKQHEWEPEWIEQAESLVCETFVGTYAIKQEFQKLESDGMVSFHADLRVNQADTTSVQVSGDGSNSESFANISVTKKIVLSRTHKLDEYMRSPPENVKDPLQWWAQHAAMYPALSRMALDYLSIPGTCSLNDI